MRSAITRLAIFAILLGAWEFASERSWFLALLVSSPSRLTVYFISHAGQLALDLLHTGAVAAGGLVVAILLGAAIALIALRYRAATSLVEGSATVAQSIPLVVFAPFTIMLFQTGYASQIVLAAIMALFPWVVGLISATRASQAEYEELLKLYKTSLRSRVFGVYLPHALPSLLVTIRVSAALSVLGAVLAEFTGSAVGLGRNIFLGTIRLDPELIMSALLLTSLLGVAVHLVLSRWEKRAAWWR